MGDVVVASSIVSDVDVAVHKASARIFAVSTDFSYVVEFDALMVNEADMVHPTVSGVIVVILHADIDNTGIFIVSGVCLWEHRAICSVVPASLFSSVVDRLSWSSRFVSLVVNAVIVVITGVGVEL